MTFSAFVLGAECACGAFGGQRGGLSKPLSCLK